MKIRYELMPKIVEILKPKSVLEIGVAQGNTAVNMIKYATEYHGFDVFDYSDSEFHDKVGNGKPSAPIDKIFLKLKKYNDTCKINLYKGFTQETLHTKNFKVQLAYIDGDHRKSEIMKDYVSVKESEVIIFDDYYISDHGKYTKDKFGCNELVDSLSNILISNPTKKYSNIRWAIYTKNETLRIKIRDIL